MATSIANGARPHLALDATDGAEGLRIVFVLAEYLPASEEIDGVRVLRIAGRPRSRDYYFAPELYRVLRSLEPDIVHCQGYHTFVAPLAMLAARRMKTPYLVTFHSGGHSSWFRRRLRPLQWRLLRPLVARSVSVIAVSDFESDLIRTAFELSPEQITVIPNGADIAQPCANGVEVDPDLIVSIGRVERFKGHHKVVEGRDRPRACGCSTQGSSNVGCELSRDDSGWTTASRSRACAERAIRSMSSCTSAFRSGCASTGVMPRARRRKNCCSISSSQPR